MQGRRERQTDGPDYIPADGQKDGRKAAAPPPGIHEKRGFLVLCV